MVVSGLKKFCVGEKKMIVDRVFIIRIFEYSARKNSANGPPAYSTLKPDTSSDSPSVRSNGARFVSASVEINHIAAMGHVGSRSQVVSCAYMKLYKVKLPERRIVESRISPKVTS